MRRRGLEMRAGPQAECLCYRGRGYSGGHRRCYAFEDEGSLSMSARKAVQRGWWRLATTWAGTVCVGAVSCLLLTAVSHGRPWADARTAAEGAAQAGSHFAIADFDGDSRPDLATVQVGLGGAADKRYLIDFELSAGVRQSIGVTAPAGGLEIASRDVNGDLSLDLVVTTAWLSQPVAVLLNDGHGNFTYREAAAFSSITWRYDTSWSASGAEIRDVSALASAATALDSARRTGAAAPRTALTFSSRPRARSESPKFRVSGRAPPASVLS